MIRDLPGASSNQLSVSAWVYATGIQAYDGIVSEYVDAPGAWQFDLGLFGTDGDLRAYVCQRNGDPVDLREGAAKPLPLYQWQHVAFVADGTTLRLYRNGVEVATTPCDGIFSVPVVERLTIGCKPVGSLWLGGIDEVAIFYRALAPEQVRQLSANGRLDAKSKQ